MSGYFKAVESECRYKGKFICVSGKTNDTGIIIKRWHTNNGNYRLYIFMNDKDFYESLNKEQLKAFRDALLFQNVFSFHINKSLFVTSNKNIVSLHVSNDFYKIPVFQWFSKRIKNATGETIQFEKDKYLVFMAKLLDFFDNDVTG